MSAIVQKKPARRMSQRTGQSGHLQKPTVPTAASLAARAVVVESAAPSLVGGLTPAQWNALELQAAYPAIFSYEGGRDCGLGHSIALGVDRILGQRVRAKIVSIGGRPGPGTAYLYRLSPGLLEGGEAQALRELIWKVVVAICLQDKVVFEDMAEMVEKMRGQASSPDVRRLKIIEYCREHQKQTYSVREIRLMLEQHRLDGVDERVVRRTMQEMGIARNMRSGRPRQKTRTNKLTGLS